jgi:hypothetical protein
MQFKFSAFQAFSLARKAVRKGWKTTASSRKNSKFYLAENESAVNQTRR